MEYIVNERGARKVLMDVEEYERLVEVPEDAEDLRVAREELVKLESGETERVPRKRR